MRYRRSTFLFSTLGLVVLLLSACAGALPAEMSGERESETEFEEAHQEIEFVGVVESMADDSWTVSGVSFSIDSSTEIKGGFALSDPVKVQATLDASDQLAAREIQHVEPLAVENKDGGNLGPNDEIEFTGYVDSMGGGSWAIDGRAVVVTDSTEIKDAIVVGDRVEVHAFDADGVLTAREIELANEEESLEEGDDSEEIDEDDEDKIAGTLEAISGDTWTVAGVTFLVSDDTEIKGDIQVGDQVKVELIKTNSGEWVAKEIEFSDDDEGSSETDDDEDDREHDDEDSEDGDHHDGDEEPDEDDSHDDEYESES